MYEISLDVSKKLTELLLLNNLITKEQLDKITAKENNIHNGYIHNIVNNGYCSEKDILEVLAKYYALQHVVLNSSVIEEKAFKTLDKRFIIENQIIPFAISSNIVDKKITDTLKVAIIDPSKIIIKQKIETIVGIKVEFYLTNLSSFEYVFSKKNLNFKNESLNEKERIKKLLQMEQLRERNAERFKSKEEISEENLVNNPVILFVDDLLKKAYSLNASDIHIEPYKITSRIRFRIDGLLYTQYSYYSFVNQNFNAIITRLKLLANCDISEHRLPQDGGLIFLDDDNNEVDVRLSVLPSKYGERIVLRLISKATSFSIDEIGLNKEEKINFIKAIESPQGMILVTGQTGSGKSTTLYAALRYINRENINILTVEDPIEHYLEGVGQVQVNENIGLGFADVLRSFLRQDPEVILVGEIRDKETVDVALKAAFTGHLVFSTLHTNDAISTIMRLLNMGIAKFMITSAISLIIAQRLIRKNCPICIKEDENIGKDLLLSFGFSNEESETVIIKKSKGCPKCRNTGFRGRQGIYEMLAINSQIENAIITDKSEAEILSISKENGFKSMHEQGRDLIKQGILCVEEYQRTLMANYGNI